MGSDDIVRKAMAMADKEVSHQRRQRSAKDDKEYVLLTHLKRNPNSCHIISVGTNQIIPVL